MYTSHILMSNNQVNPPTNPSTNPSTNPTTNSSSQNTRSNFLKLLDSLSPTQDIEEIAHSTRNFHSEQSHTVQFHETIGGVRMTIRILSQTKHTNTTLQKLCQTLKLQFEAILTLIEQLIPQQVDDDTITIISETCSKAISFATGRWTSLKTFVIQEFSEMVSELTFVIKVLSVKSVARKIGVSSFENQIKKLEMKHGELMKIMLDLADKKEISIQKKLEQLDHEAEERTIRLMSDIRTVLKYLLENQTKQNAQKIAPKNEESKDKSIVRRIAQLVVTHMKTSREIQKQVDRLRLKSFHRFTHVVDRNNKKTSHQYYNISEAIKAGK